MADEPTPAPVRPGNLGRNDYPKMLYHPDGRTCGVEDATEHDKLAREGWDTVPADIHRQRSATPTPAMSSSEPLGQMMREVFASVLVEFGFSKKGDTRHGQP